jgi:hypothetical protein
MTEERPPYGDERPADWIDAAAEEIDLESPGHDRLGPEQVAAIIRKHFDGAHGRRVRLRAGGPARLWVPHMGLADGDSTSAPAPGTETDALDFPARDYAAVHAHPGADRISARELDEIEREWTTPKRADGTRFADENPVVDAAEQLVPKLVAELRRLRSLVAKTAIDSGDIYCPRVDGDCWWCMVILEPAEGAAKPHKPECPWPEIEAEALAQREDEKC